jgi:hypothetical protein
VKGKKGKDEKGGKERGRAGLEADPGDPSRDDNDETTTRPLAGPFPFTYSIHTLSAILRKLLTKHGRAEGTGGCVTVQV